MPFVQLEDFKCAPITAENGDLITYGEIFKPSEIAETDIDYDTREPAEFYADNRVIETILPSALTGTLTVNLGRYNSKLIAKMLGTQVEENGDIVASGQANAPAFGAGVIPSGPTNGKMIYYPRFFPKVTFSLPNESFATMAENVDFKTTTVVGKFVTTSGPKAVLYISKEFPAEDKTEAAAKRALVQAQNWLNGKLGQNIQVQFNLNGANADDVEGGQPQDQNLAAGRDVPVAELPQLQREGYRFLGWCLTQAGAALVERFVPGIGVLGDLVDGAQTLYALWQQNG